jgi:ribonucrease Y
LIDFQHKIVENAEESANIKAREIVGMAVQRCSSEVANELTITTIKISSEEDKGKLIGKGGRNIQWLEKTLGVELIIDETPEVVTLSGFSSIRRNIAKKTLEKLLADGRIHPSSIEEMYEKAKAEIAQEIAEAGEEAVNDLGIYDFPAKLIRLIGRLKYRTSYGQNMMKHSLEMARLAGLLADEMNSRFPNRKNPIDKMICIKGALLHDIGKAVDEESIPKGDHVEIGEKICDMFGLDWRIKKCISSHHNEAYTDPEKGFCLEAVLVDACDNISGGRLGARKETAEAYFQRMRGIENVAESTPGVLKSWIMRGSRELWVFFDTQVTTPAKMHTTTRLIAKKIGSSVRAPFKIKVIGFFEDRAVEYAA